MTPARRAASHIAAAALAVAAAVVLRWLMDPWLGPAQPFVTLSVAVAIVVWFIGYPAALFAAALGYVVADFLFLYPEGVSARSAGGIADLIAYVVTCALIIGFGEAMHRAKRGVAGVRRELAERQQRLGGILESISDGFYSVDRDWRFVYINAQAERYFGRTRQDMMGRSIWEVYPEAVGSALHQRLQQALAERSPAQFEIVLPLSQRWYEVRVYPSEDGLAVYFNDVQGRKEADAALVLAKAEAERRAQDLAAAKTAGREVESSAVAAQHLLQVVADSVPALLSYVDRDLRYRMNNRAYETWFGRPRAEFHGRHVSEMLGETAWQSVRRHAELALRGTPSTFESSLHDASGRPVRWIKASFTPDVDASGTVSGYVVHAMDMTDSKRIENALQKRNERLALLWEAAAVLLSTDEPGTMLGHLFARIAPHLGLDVYLNFMVGESADDLQLDSCTGVRDEMVDALRRVALRETVCGAVARDRSALVTTDIQRSEDPRVRVLKRLGVRAYVCNPLIAGERLLGTLSFGSRTRDAFDPDELDFLRTVTHYVTLAYERLRLMKELREADRRKDEFLSVLAHELRNPLAPLRNGLEVIRLVHEDPRVVRDAAEMMQRQIAIMVRLIDDLLDVSRITRGKVELRPQRVELAAVVGQAVEGCRPNFEMMGHSLTIDLPDTPVYLDADPVRIAQVIANLLNNACKFTEWGGRITLNAERRESTAAISVTDTGIGIPREKLESVFDMFVQVDPSPERRHGGLGLGLTLVKSLVELHGGTVRAQSAGPGKGAEIVVQLPLAGDQQRAPEKPAAKVSPLAACRVLVIDDSVDSTKSLAAILHLMGHEVQTAQSGLEALAVVAHFRPDLVLCDIGMPGMNGFETAHKLRELLGPAVTLAALTGYGSEDDRARARAAGFDLHLVKPVDSETLHNALAACGGRLAQRA